MVPSTHHEHRSWSSERILADLLDAEVEFIGVGGLAAVVMGAPVVAFDLELPTSD